MSRLLGLWKNKFMTTDPTITRIKTILAEHMALEPDTILETSRFYDDLGCDSLDAVEIVMAIEEEFQIELTDEEADEEAGGIETVSDAVKLVDYKMI